MTKFTTSARRALATFLFSTIGVLAGTNLFDADVATWKVAVSTGIGAVANLLYRWSEAVVNERRSSVDDEIVGADVKDHGAINAMTVLIFLGIAVLVVILIKLVDVNVR